MLPLERPASVALLADGQRSACVCRAETWLEVAIFIELAPLSESASLHILFCVYCGVSACTQPSCAPHSARL